MASLRGIKGWQPPYGPAGTVQAKVADATTAAQLMFEAFAGHPCGGHFKAADHLQRHPEFAWQKGLLRDVLAGRWNRWKIAGAF